MKNEVLTFYHSCQCFINESTTRARACYQYSCTLRTGLSWTDISRMVYVSHWPSSANCIDRWLHTASTVSSAPCKPLKRMWIKIRKLEMPSQRQGYVSFSLYFDSWGHEAESVASFRIVWVTELEVLYLQSLIQEHTLLSCGPHSCLVEAGMRGSWVGGGSMRSQIEASLNKVEEWWHLLLLPKKKAGLNLVELWFHTLFCILYLFVLGFYLIEHLRLYIWI